MALMVKESWTVFRSRCGERNRDDGNIHKVSCGLSGYSEPCYYRCNCPRLSQPKPTKEGAHG